MASSRGGGGSGGGMRFALRFEVEGSGKRELQNILRTMRQVSAAVAGTAGTGGPGAPRGGKGGVSSLGDQFQKLAKQIYYVNPAIGRLAYGLASLSNLNSTLIPGVAGLAGAFIGLSVGTAVLDSVNQAGMNLVRWGATGVGTILAIGKGIMDTIGPLETAITQIKTLGGMDNAQAFKVLENIQDIIRYTPFQQEELVGMTQALVMGKARLDDWTDSAGKAITLQDALNQGWARNEVPTFAREMKVSATSIMADFAALTGNIGDRAATFNRGIQRLFSVGSARLLTDQVNQEALTALVGKAGTLQLQGTAEDALQRIYDYLKEKQALGMSAIASGTYEGLIKNVEEIPKIFAQAIGGLPGSGGLYDRILAGLQGLYDEVSKFMSNKAAMTAIKDALEPVLDFLLEAGRQLLTWIRNIAEFFTNNPFLMRMVTWGTLLGGALAVATGLAVVFGAALASVVLVISMGVLALSAFNILMSHFSVLVMRATKAVLILGASVAGVMLLVAAITALAAAAGFFVIRSEAFQNFWEKTKVLISATSEAIKNWSSNMTSISAETAQSLEKAGLLGFFLKTVSYIRRIQLWWESTTDKISAGWDAISERVSHAANVFAKVLGEAFLGVGTALGLAIESLDTLGTDGTSSISNAVTALGLMLEMGLMVATGFMSMIKPLMTAVFWLDIIRVAIDSSLDNVKAGFAVIGAVLEETVIAPFKWLIGAIMTFGKVLASTTNEDRYAALQEFGNTKYFGNTEKMDAAAANWDETRSRASRRQTAAWNRYLTMAGELDQSRAPSEADKPVSGYMGMDGIGESGVGLGHMDPYSMGARLGLSAYGYGSTPKSPDINAKIESSNTINVNIDSELVIQQLQRKLDEARARVLGKTD